MDTLLVLYVVLLSCAIQGQTLHSKYQFEIEYEWSYLNFTWPSVQRYRQAINSAEYIPENNAPTGMKIYKRNLYLSIPRFRRGIPVTLAYIPMDTSNKINELLIPFPNWEMNDVRDCSNLQSIQSMEIDTGGVMWILDGVRLRNNVNCPAKLVFLDLNSRGSFIYSYIFPNEISLGNGGFLNDIVIDETDGGFAYITDNSNIDPGLIVYSRRMNHAWKIRDRSMFPDPWAANFVVENVRMENMIPIDGIALSPRPINKDANRTVFYTSITSLNLFAISTTVLRDEQLCRSDRWRKSVQYIGKKESQTDGMVVDSKGTLYYTLLPLYGVGSWNIWDNYASFKILDINRFTMVWPDGFAMDQEGYLYLISNAIFNYINPNTVLKWTPSEIKFRISRLYTGTRSYLYNDV